MNGDQISEKLAPNSPEAEEAVLGSLLINPDGLRRLKQRILPHYFFILRNRYVYEAMLSLHERKEDVDILTVGTELQERNHLTLVGGRAYLTNLMNSAPTHIHVETYALIVKEAWRRRQLLILAQKLGESSLEGSPEAAALILDEARELLNDPYGLGIDETNTYLIHARDLKNLPPVTWLVPGEIPDLALTVVYGPSGVGKSFFVLDYALALAQCYPVLYIAAEGESGFVKRVAAWCKHHKEAEGDLYFYLNLVSLLDTVERDRFMQQVIGRVKPKLVILDTVAHCMLPGNENDTRDMGLFLKSAKLILKTFQCAVLLVHHTGKEGNQERGSSVLRASADAMIKLSGEDETITVECSKSKDSAPFPSRYIKLLPVQLDDGESRVVVGAEKVVRTPNDPLTIRQRRALEALHDTFEFGAALSDLMEVTKIGKGGLLEVLSVLKKMGFVRQADRGAPYEITEQGVSLLQKGLPDHKESSQDSPSESTYSAKDSRTPRSEDSPDDDQGVLRVRESKESSLTQLAFIPPRTEYN